MESAPIVAKHLLDPEGDTILILSNPNAAFAKFDPKHGVASMVKLPESETVAQELQAVPTCSAESSSKQPGPSQGVGESGKRADDIHFRLSSKHLATASSYFRVQLYRPWKDSAQKGATLTVHAQDWSETALLLVLRIMHCQGDKIPHDVPVELLARIAVIIDYYGCHDACSFHYNTWIVRPGFQKTILEGSGRDQILALFASYVFSAASIFANVSEIVAKASRGRMHSLDLPIPESVIDGIATKRREALVATAAALGNVLRCFDGSDKSVGCDVFSCSAMHTGALLNDLRHKGLDINKLEQAVDGYSVVEVHKALRLLRQPPVFLPRTTPTHSCRENSNTPFKHECARDSALGSAIVKIKCQGLTLSNFQKVGTVKQASTKSTPTQKNGLTGKETSA